MGVSVIWDVGTRGYWGSSMLLNVPPLMEQILMIFVGFFKTVGQHLETMKGTCHRE